MRRTTNPRRGSVLVEFAIVALALYLLLAATIEFGRMMYSAQAVQSAADVGARELAKVPLPPGMTFADAMATDDVRRRVFSPDFLVVDLAQVPADVNIADYYAQNAPPVNQQLFPLMIVDDQRSDGGPWLLRYPGRVKDGTGTPRNTYNPGNKTVDVPVLVGGSESNIEYHEVVEEVLTSSGVGPFSLTAAVPAGQEWQRGLVALRINYPYQAATMASYPPESSYPPATDPQDVPFHRNVLNPNEVRPDDRAAPGDPVGPNTGKEGLGRLYAVNKQVRPYRKVLTGQAFARRELFN